MSWKVTAVGKPRAVAAKVATDFANVYYLSGHEAALKDAAADIVARALEASMTAAVAVRVDCSGWASPSLDGATQVLKIDISPIFGFVE